MGDQTFHCGRKHCCRYCLQVFSTVEILKLHIEDSFKVETKQRIIKPEKEEYDKFKIYEREIIRFF